VAAHFSGTTSSYAGPQMQTFTTCYSNYYRPHALPVKMPKEMEYETAIILQMAMAIFIAQLVIKNCVYW